MVAVRLLFLPGCLLLAFILFESSCAQAAEKRAVVAGAPVANMRVGAGIDHGVRAKLKEGDRVSVGKRDGEWYEVTTADGQNGYVHRSLLKVGGEAPSPQPAQAADENRIGTSTKESIGTSGTTSRVASAGAAKAQNSKALEPAAAPNESNAAEKSPSIVQMLEGHENELMIAAAIAAAFFFIGWICGGNYYLRRERRQRNRIRF